LFGVFSAEPLALDLRGIDIRKIRSEEAQNAVATLAAPIHGKSKEELLGLELRLRRRRRLLTAFAALMIALFGAGFIWKGLEAQKQQDTARKERNRAHAKELAERSKELARRSSDTLSQDQPVQAFRFAVEAWKAYPDWVAQETLYHFARSGLRTNFAHDRVVSSAEMSPDGRFAVTTGGGMKVWKPDGTFVFKIDRGGDFAIFAPDSSGIAYGGSDVAFLTCSGKEKFKVSTGSISHGIFCPDGELLTASGDKQVRRWDRAGHRVREYPCDDNVSALAVSTDGSRIAAGTMNGEVRSWSAAGAEVRTFRNRKEVASLEFSPDGAKLFARSRDGVLTMFPLAGGTAKVLGKNTVLTFAVSPQRAQIAALCSDGIIRLINATGESLRSLRGLAPEPAEPTEQGISTPTASRLSHTVVLDAQQFFPPKIQFAAGGRLIAASAGDTTQVWDVEANRIIRELPQKPLLTVTRDGQHLLTAGQYSALLWEIEPGAAVAAWRQKSAVSTLALAPDGKTLVIASLDGNARILDRKGRVTATLSHGAALASACFSRDGKMILTVGRDAAARLWTIEGKTLAEFRHGDLVHNAAISSDGERVVTASADGSAAIWTTKGARLATLKHQDEVYTAAFSPNGELVVTGGRDRIVRAWTQAGAPRWTAPMSESVQWIAFSHDGQHVVAATVTTGSEVSVFDPASGKVLARLPHPDEVIAAGVSPTRDIVITSAADRMVRVWEMSGRLITQLYHERPVRSVALSEDGMRVLTGSDDGDARLFDLSGNTKELFVFSHAEPIQQAAFATGGDQVITCSEYGVKTWDFGSPDSIIARYRNTVGELPKPVGDGTQ
jgi:WD40 repeat protein